MKLSDIKQALIEHPILEEKKTKFSILIPIIEIDDSAYLLYEVRSKNLRNQPGEICFPGGGVEPDESDLQAAIRETAEELNINPDTIVIFDDLPVLQTPFGTSIMPFIGHIQSITSFSQFQQIQYNKDEVDHLFLVPVDWLIENPPIKYDIHTKMDIPDDFPFDMIQNGREYGWKTNRYPIYFFPYKGEIIWGITARITESLIEIFRKKEPL